MPYLLGNPSICARRLLCYGSVRGGTFGRRCSHVGWEKGLTATAAQRLFAVNFTKEFTFPPK